LERILRCSYLTVRRPESEAKITHKEASVKQIQSRGAGPRNQTGRFRLE